MKTSPFSDSQIIAVLTQAEGGSPVPERCREYGISYATFYNWRSKIGGMDAWISCLTNFLTLELPLVYVIDDSNREALAIDGDLSLLCKGARSDYRVARQTADRSQRQRP